MPEKNQKFLFSFIQSRGSESAVQHLTSIDKGGGTPCKKPKNIPSEMELVTMHKGVLKFRMNPNLSHSDQYGDVIVTSSP